MKPLVRVSDLVVRISESNITFDCQEGSIGDIEVVSYRDTSGFPVLARIRNADHSASILHEPTRIGGRAAPLLGTRFDPSGGAYESFQFYDLRTGKKVFAADEPPLFFVANGVVRYIATSSGQVTYTTVDGPTQVLDIPGEVGDFDHSHISFSGTRPWGGTHTLGSALSGKDTVPVTGLTIDFILQSPMDERVVRRTIQIVGDRLVLTPK